jgi:hypothetical protein
MEGEKGKEDKDGRRHGDGTDGQRIRASLDENGRMEGRNTMMQRRAD